MRKIDLHRGWKLLKITQNLIRDFICSVCSDKTLACNNTSNNCNNNRNNGNKSNRSDNKIIIINVDNFQVGYYWITAREVATLWYSLRFFSPFFFTAGRALQKFLSINCNQSLYFVWKKLAVWYPRRCSRIILCSFGPHYIVSW